MQNTQMNIAKLPVVSESGRLCPLGQFDIHAPSTLDRSGPVAYSRDFADANDILSTPPAI
ncbi:MAG: hypothetical protein ACF8R9_02230 [Phycisphaerales bacterium JB054]